MLMIALDLQIKICTFLHPSDILTLRQTCKDLRLVTKRRIVWIDALHRTCLDNSLFLPSFPIPDMNDAELERAAMAPYRWINLCVTFAKQHSIDSGTALRPTKTRIIQDSLILSTNTFFVPGGRYLIGYSSGGIGVWDVGYTPDADCRLLASVGPDRAASLCLVNVTPDGMGLIILAFGAGISLTVYEIFPQNESPQLTQVGEFDSTPLGRIGPCRLLPNKLVWFRNHQDRIIFTVWDYRLNHSISFSDYIHAETIHDMCYHEIIATPTTIILLCKKGILVWGIPPLLPFAPLSPHLPDSNHDATHIPALFTFPWPDDLILQTRQDWEIVSEWYSACSQSIYFGVLCQDFKLVNFEIVIKPDLSDISLRAIKSFQLDHEGFYAVSVARYRISENNLVSCSRVVGDHLDPFIIYIRSMSSPPNDLSPEPPISLHVSLSGSQSGYPSSCPASGRLIRADANNQRIVVVDFLPYL